MLVNIETLLQCEDCQNQVCSKSTENKHIQGNQHVALLQVLDNFLYCVLDKLNEV